MPKSGSLPGTNLVYGYDPQNYGVIPGYQGMAPVSMQGRMVAMPVMGYTQMQPVQGYAMPGAYAYNYDYYK